MLGGGVFVTQNKTLPGSYINFVSAGSTTSAIGERGSVAVVLDLGKIAQGEPNRVIECTKSEYLSNGSEIVGFNPHDDSTTSVAKIVLNEIFCHANKVYVYDGDPTSNDVIEKAFDAFESYEFNVICCLETTSAIVGAYRDKIMDWRDNIGKKCQLVVGNASNTPTNHEGIINVMASVEQTSAGMSEYVDTILAAWVAGAEAGCKVNESCTNMLYDGELTIIVDKTQAQLEQCIKSGQITFHLVYGEVRMLEDVNTLTNFTADKGEDFKYNQTIRVIDQIANDIAKLFNTKYLGKIPNNASGRVSLWADIVAHHRELESIQAIESFDATLLTVEQGATKKSVVVNDVITVVNAMGQLYMTVVVQ